MTKLLTISFDSTKGDFYVEINKDELHSKELIALGLNSLYKELPDILPSSLALALYISEDPDYLACILNYRVHRIISHLEDYSILNSKKISQNQ